jgi:hypothetical protein
MGKEDTDCHDLKVLYDVEFKQVAPWGLFVPNAILQLLVIATITIILMIMVQVHQFRHHECSTQPEE